MGKDHKSALPGKENNFFDKNLSKEKERQIEGGLENKKKKVCIKEAIPNEVKVDEMEMTRSVLFKMDGNSGMEGEELG